MAPQLSPTLLALFAHVSGDALQAFLTTALVAATLGIALGVALRLGAQEAGGALRDAVGALGSTALLVTAAAVLPYLRWRTGGAHAPAAAHLAPLALVGAGWLARWVDQALRAASADPTDGAVRLHRLPVRAAAPRIAAGWGVALLLLAVAASVALAVGGGADGLGAKAGGAPGLPDGLLGVVLLLIALAQAARTAGDWVMGTVASGRVLHKA